jgi:hypothetical protein
MARPPDDQPTVFSEEAARKVQEGDAVSVASPPPAVSPSPGRRVRGRASRADTPIAKRTGIVFVHGIGTQAPAETFLDWSGPIVELLTDWRAAKAGEESAERIDDPVWRAEFGFNAASPPYLELAIPGRDEIPTTTWVFTEAWWAADLRAPNLGRTIDYLRRRMRSVVTDIVTGYSRGRNARLKERAQAAKIIGEGPLPLDWRLAEGLDLLQSRTFGSPILGWLVGGIGAIALGGYDLLRRVPLPVIRDFAVRRMVDSFLIDWFGDLPVLLDDHVQAANVRARLARSIQRLVDDRCDAVVIVAHSGGALVSFETLLDPAYAHLRVDKLITLGQGLGLAWRLAEDQEVHEISPGHRLVGDLAAIRPNLRWVDFWASYDPAPAGPLPAREIDGTPDDVAATLSASKLTSVATGDRATRRWLVQAPVALPTETPITLPEGTIMVESRPVTNEMNVLTDHGAYWANPEGFLVPLVRHMDAARGDASASRFYRDDADRTRRILWRRERVSALAAWGWLCSLGAIATTVGLIVLQAIDGRRLTAAGDGVVAVWDRIPGHEIVSGPVVAIGTVLGAVLDTLGLGAVADGLGSLGPPVVGLALAIGLFYALAKVGLGRWHDWDRRERRATHPEEPSQPDRSLAFAQALLLFGGLIGLTLAAFGAAVAAFLIIVLGAVAGLLVWIRRPFRMAGIAASDAPRQDRP